MAEQDSNADGLPSEPRLVTLLLYFLQILFHSLIPLPHLPPSLPFPNEVCLMIMVSVGNGEV